MTFLVEAVCPNGHRICGMPADGPDLASEEEKISIAAALSHFVRDAVEAHIASGVVSPNCPVCGADRKQWSLEVGQVKGDLTREQVEQRLATSSTSIPVIKPKPETIH